MRRSARAESGAAVPGGTRAVSLRARVVTTLVIVVSMGLAVAGIATWLSVRSFEISRVDAELQLAQVPVAHALDVASFNPGSAAHQALESLPSGTVGAVVNGSGKPLLWVFPFGTNQPGGTRPPSPPRVPSSALGPAQKAGNGISFSTSAYLAGSSYRILTRSLPSGNYFVVGMPMSDVTDTLAHLALAEAIVGAGVLIVLGLAARGVVGVGLRPLEQMVDTAGAIAAGDLSRRVPADGESSEIGRLGTALNEMLSHIEASFAAQAASEERLRRFVADAGHELRTPLTSIQGYAELFRRGAASRPDDLALAMRRIEQESARMRGLVDDLLLLAKLDERKSLSMGPVELSLLAADAVSDAHAIDPERPIALDCPVELEIVGDEARLRQVFANLISNALAHTPAASPIKVRVSSSGSGPGSAGALIEVEDRGPGLEPEDAARVFERFYRAERSRSRTMGGSGLGLSIVQAIAAAHGGRASVTSVRGQGATFSVFIPSGPLPESARPTAPPERIDNKVDEAVEGSWVVVEEPSRPAQR